MKISSKIGLCVLLALLLLTCQSTSPEDVIYLVKDGQPLAVEGRGESWHQEGSAYVGTGWYNELYSSIRIGDGDFISKTVMVMDRVDTTTALVKLFDNDFGFDSKPGDNGNSGNFFFYCRSPKKYQEFEKARDFITPGKAFEFVMERKDSTLQFRVDNQVVVELPVSALGTSREGVIAFRPWYNTMRIKHWSIEGTFDPLPDQDWVFRKGEMG